MANMMDYIEWRGDLTFSERPFNEVDGLIFAELSYVDYSNIVPNTVVEGITLKRAAEEYFLKYPDSRGRLGIVVPDSIHDLLRAAGNSERFGSVVLSGYTAETSEEKEEQFSAVTFTIENRIRCIAFRGTDDSIVGWKENFNMCYMFPVPAQSDAANYLNMVAADWNKDLIITGHSKGGNLAVYAAAYCLPEAQEHITAVYNFDGPGFPTSQITLENYSRIRGLMTTLLPEADIVGILLDHEDQYHAVKSNAVGVWQHRWLLMGADGYEIHIQRGYKEQQQAQGQDPQGMGGRHGYGASGAVRQQALFILQEHQRPHPHRPETGSHRPDERHKRSV